MALLNPTSDLKGTSASPLLRTVIWFSCVLLAIAVFSFVVFGHSSLEAFGVVFHVTAYLAFPVAALFLPVVLSFRQRNFLSALRTLMLGTLVGPVAMVLWSLILIWHGSDARSIWHGDPEVGFGIWGEIAFAAFVGGLATGLYLLALSLWSASTESR